MWGRSGGRRGDPDDDDRWSTGGNDRGVDELFGFGEPEPGAGRNLGWGVSDLALPGVGVGGFGRGGGVSFGGVGFDDESEDETWWGGWEAEDEGELGEWKWAMVVVKEGEHKKKTGIVTAIHGHCPRHKHPLEKIKEDDDPWADEQVKGEPKEDKKQKKKKGPRLECEMCKAAKKKDKASAEAAEDGKPKPVAFGCEDCNWYVCADCHGKKGEKQWQCMLQVDLREGFEVHREWFAVDHLRLFAEAEDDMDLDDDDEKEDVNLAKKFYPDLVEGQVIKASLSSAGRWGFTTRFMYDAVVTRCQEDGSYDVKFHDQLLGEKKGLPIEELESLLTFEASGLGLDPSRNFFDFRFNSLPRGVQTSGNGVELKPAGDSGGSILYMKPASYLSMPLEGLAPGGAGSGEDHVKYTLSLELKLPLQRSQHPVALVQASWPEVSGLPQLSAVADAYVPVHPADRDYAEEPPEPGTTWSWHLQLGNVVLSRSELRPGRWHEITLVVNCKEGRAFVTVDGKQVRDDQGESWVVIGEGAGKSPLAIKRGGFLLFAAAEASWMPGGCFLRRCSFQSDCLSMKQLEQVRYQNRSASAKIRDYLKEQLPQQELSLTPILRRKAMPLWRSDWFLAEFGQNVYPSDSGAPLTTFQVFILAAEKIFQTSPSPASIVGLMSETMQKDAAGTVALIKAAEPLYRRLNNCFESPEPQVIVFYLKAVKQLRSKMANVGDACIIPLALGNAIVPLLLERKEEKGAPCYRMTICNGGDGTIYHRQSARSPPKLKYQTCMIFDGIPCERAEDEAFWTTMVTACLISSEKAPEELFYDTFLPYLMNTPAVVDVLYPKKPPASGVEAPETDFHSVPQVFGPWRSLTLLWKHLLRTRAGLSKQQVKCLKWELRASLISMSVHDLKASKGLDTTDVRLLKLGCGSMSFAAVRNHTTATDSRPDEDTLSLPASTKSLWECRRLVDAVEILCAQKPRTYEGQDGSGEFASYLDLDTGEEKMSQSAVFPFFDRLLRQEVFPGRPKGVAEQLPIDLLALPEKVSSMTELFRTLRIAEEICLKLSFISRERCEYAPYLLVCLQQHLFTKLLPLPRGPFSSKLEECDIWGGWDGSHPTVTRPMQLDMLQVLGRLVELFVCASLEMRCKQHTARTFDAVKITVLSACAAMADRIVRIWPMDDRLFKSEERPSELTKALHEGRFAIDAAAFVTQSETMEACFQELSITRAASVAYFHEVTQHYKVNLDRRRTVIFDYAMHKWGMWVVGERGTIALVERMAATKLLMDPNPQNLVSGNNVMMPHIWPEFRAYRDIVFWWKYFLCTDVRVFPEPRQFHPAEAIARWSVAQDDKGRQYFKITALGKDNVVWLNERNPPQPPASGHRWPSPALPAMHTKGEVRTEDDLLYQRSLPNFADEKTGRPMLRPSDSEALLSYLTVPYLRQPLLLSFFTTQDRSNCLRQGTLQKILQATMLEPGRLLYPEDMQKIPEYVPAIAEEEHLVASPFSQILTELSHGPSQILTAVGKLMALTLSLATSVTSETVPAILFAVRLAVRVESAAAVLMDHAEGRVARAWPRLTVTPHVLEELRRGRVLLRSTFEGEVLPWFDRWMEELAESAQQEPAREDECNSLACRLHAHQVLVLRNVPTSDFDSERIKRFLSSLTYLSSHHTFNQERLEVPETELFEALHLHRRFMVRWLVEQRRVNALQGFNSVLRSCHHQLSALGDTSADTSSFEWVCVGDASEYEGRFGVLSEAAPDKEAQGEAKEKEEASKPGIKTVNASDAFWIELNVQLLQVTVRGRTLVPLEDYIWNDEDFKHVFVSELGEKGAMQKTTVQCSALLTSSNATVRELLSIPFRATYWSSKPANFLPFLDEWDRLYDVEDLEEDEFWIAELFEPVRRQFFIPPPPRRPPLWFMKDEPIPGDTTVVQLMGVHQEAKVHLFKERRMIHIYALRAYGHQLYRQLEYSSNARLCITWYPRSRKLFSVCAQDKFKHRRTRQSSKQQSCRASYGYPGRTQR